MRLHELHRLGDATDLLYSSEFLLRGLHDPIQMQVETKTHRYHRDHIQQAQHQKLSREAQTVHPSNGDRQHSKGWPGGANRHAPMVPDRTP